MSLVPVQYVKGSANYEYLYHLSLFRSLHFYSFHHTKLGIAVFWILHWNFTMTLLRWLQADIEEGLMKVMCHLQACSSLLGTWNAEVRNHQAQLEKIRMWSCLVLNCLSHSPYHIYYICYKYHKAKQSQTDTHKIYLCTSSPCTHCTQTTATPWVFFDKNCSLTGKYSHYSYPCMPTWLSAWFFQINPDFS